MKHFFLPSFIFCFTFGITQRAFSQDTWATVSSIGFTPRFGFTSSVVNGKIYVIGGSYTYYQPLKTIQVYDPITDVWATLITTGKFTRRTVSTASVVNNLIYVIGGYDANLNFVEDVDVFDPATNIWSTGSTNGNFSPRYSLTSSVVGNKIYVMGGIDTNGNVVNTLEVFDPSTNTWSTPKTTGTCTPRTDFSSCVINDKIFVMGGSKDSGMYTSYTHLNTLEVFDPSTNIWSTPNTTGTFIGRSDFTSSVVGSKIYAIGGLGYDMSYPYVIEDNVFDPSTNTWSSPLTHGVFSGRFLLSSSEVNGKIYALGGFNYTYSDSGSLNINEVLTPASNGVKTNSSSAEVLLSPNPSTGIITAYSVPENIIKVSIINILGQSVIEILNPHAPTFLLDLSKLVPGIYYARFVAQNSMVMKKIILQ